MHFWSIGDAWPVKRQHAEKGQPICQANHCLIAALQLETRLIHRLHYLPFTCSQCLGESAKIYIRVRSRGLCPHTSVSITCNQIPSFKTMQLHPGLFDTGTTKQKNTVNGDKQHVNITPKMLHRSCFNSGAWNYITLNLDDTLIQSH